MSRESSSSQGPPWQRPLSTILKDGDLFTGCYRIVKTAAWGGMSRIYLARDERNGQLVALKVLSLPNIEEIFTQRFEREIEILASIEHRNLVRALDSGRTEDGSLYLCLEWLEGKDLGDFIKAGPTPIRQALEIGRGALRGLSCVHAAGVIHRDLKPANIFVNDDAVPPEGVKLLDFGVAKLVDEHMVGSTNSALTTAGMVVGTPYYMAPEQAQGIANIDARADLFSMGSALFELICGKKPFNASSALALLVRIATEEAPSIQELMPDAPDVLDTFLRKALQRNPDDRFQTADEMELAIEELIFELESGQASTMHEIDGSVDLAKLKALEGLPSRSQSGTDLASETLRADGAIIPPISLEVEDKNETTLPEMQVDLPKFDKVSVLVFDTAAVELLREEVTDLFRADVVAAGGQTLTLRGGIEIGTFKQPTDAREGINAVVKMALRALGTLTRVNGAAGDLRIAVGTGHVAAERDMVPGDDAIDATCALLEYAEPGELVVDHDTMLLAGDIVTTRPRADHVHVVKDAREERQALQRGATEVNSAAPFVGRNEQIDSVMNAFDACALARRPYCVALIGDPGMGKTRLREELRTQFDLRRPETALFIGRADQHTRSVPYAALADALRRRGAIRGGEGSDTIYGKLDKLIPSSLGLANRSDTREQLSLLLGSPFRSEQVVTEPLRAITAEDKKAAQDEASASRARAMKQRQALLDVLRAHASAGPIALLLDDMQWADPGTMGVLRDLLRAEDLPLFVVITARPEVQSNHREIIAPLIADQRYQALPLGPLDRASVASIAAALCGNAIDDVTLDALMQRTRGNPYYLEETIFALANDDEVEWTAPKVRARLDSVPRNVHAVIQGRMNALAPNEKELLQLASIFGSIFWDQGLQALGSGGVRDTLIVLQQKDFVIAREVSRYSGTRELVFKSTQLRDVAYAMVPREHRKQLHQVAVSWLESVGEKDALTLARHYQPAGLTSHASRALLDGARRALACGDTKGAVSLSAEGLALADTATTTADRLALLRVKKEALELLGQYDNALRSLEAVVALELSDESTWKHTQEQAQLMLLKGDSASSLRMFREAVAAEELRGAQHEAGWLTLGVGDAMSERGDIMNGCTQFQRAYSAGKTYNDEALMAHAIHRLGRVAYATADLGQAMRLFEDAERRFETESDARYAAYARLAHAASASLAGDAQSAVSSCAVAKATLELVPDRRGVLACHAIEAFVQYEARDPAGALQIVNNVVHELSSLESRQPELLAGLVAVRSFLELGRNQEAAERAHRLFGAAVRTYPRFVVPVESLLGLAMARTGDAVAGLKHVEAAVARLETQKATEDDDPHRIYAQYAETLELAGDVTRAHQIWRQAKATMVEVSSRLPAANRAGFAARPINYRISERGN